MLKRKRIYCPYCGVKVILKKEGDTLREYCTDCRLFFYNNPLPVVSAIVLKDRKVLLVKRKNAPYRGKWCLPSGFSEIGESIEDASLRELKEEAGIEGVITSLVDVDWTKNYYYGDLIFHTFEVEQTGGTPLAGDDAIDVKYFPIHKTPKLAFKSNTKAVEAFIKGKTEFWAIIDSFKLSINEKKKGIHKTNFLSDNLVNLIEKNAHIIAHRWINDVTTNKSTPHYQKFKIDLLYVRIMTVLSQFGKWLEGDYINKDIQIFYRKLGQKRKKEGFDLSEVLSALSLSRKHIWEFALSQGIHSKTIDIYRTLELERRIVIFFDKAAHYVSKGYEEN